MLKDHPTTAFGSGQAEPVPIPRTSFSWDEGLLQVSGNETPKNQETEDAMPGVHRDLCCICTYKAECMYCGTPAQPKLCCELFDVDVKSLVPHESQSEGTDSDGDGVRDVKGGLCCNCENREHCAIRKPEGTVWHCEEYC